MKIMKSKILVVDDIKKNIQVLGSVLGKEGYAVSYATDGGKALDMTATEDFDIILLDIMMPGMDGFEVCQKLKKYPQTREIPILFLTAKSEQDDIIRGFHHGAVDYLTKPFNTAELIARVKTQISLRQAQRIILERNAELEKKNEELERLLAENKQAKCEINTLRGILPICSHCKKIRTGEGYWTAIESYISKHSEAEFSHGMCQDCAQELYPDIFANMNNKI